MWKSTVSLGWHIQHKIHPVIKECTKIQILKMCQIEYICCWSTKKNEREKEMNIRTYKRQTVVWGCVSMWLNHVNGLRFFATPTGIIQIANILQRQLNWIELAFSFFFSFLSLSNCVFYVLFSTSFLANGTCHLLHGIFFLAPNCWFFFCFYCCGWWWLLFLPPWDQLNA